MTEIHIQGGRALIGGEFCETDRGTIAEGQRADILLVDDALPMRPRIVAVIAGGRLVHLTDADRIATGRAARFEAIAAE